MGTHNYGLFVEGIDANSVVACRFIREVCHIRIRRQVDPDSAFVFENSLAVIFRCYIQGSRGRQNHSCRFIGIIRTGKFHPAVPRIVRSVNAIFVSSSIDDTLMMTVE
ncbi:hypothetical protein D3C73_1124190 [compost metagenome]